ncbi:Bloom syndrome protein homolog isoform X1 [Rhizophagus clarus]|uniref:Bloom syndrome protein homolog isoform X1 n=1 Tax=Rhizophagus clarus TaxID=94130 RepID=A0A8H3LUF3_9GLOM|nr:Bloom syndrome protein homolog isoform X1 [Rhizophagus clarus]
MSFINEKNTLVILLTSSGKTMCWVTPTLISKGLTVIFTPLKVLIDDQIRKLINIKIPCVSLYISTSHPFNYQEKVFDEAYCIVKQEHFCEAQKIQTIMNIQVGDLNVVQNSSFVYFEITFEVQTKSFKERTINEICEQI